MVLTIQMLFISTKRRLNFCGVLILTAMQLYCQIIGNCGEIYYVDIKKLIHKQNALAPNAILLRTKKANLKFLFYAFLDTWFQKQLINIIASSAQPKFTKTDLRDLLIPLPPLNEQIAIANVLSGLDHEIISLKNKKRQFDNIKKALNHDLMSAKIRVLKK
ncbi:restriction endonuclease subunit S [Helicobacter pylori]|nr:restriction endonuclease subunit S [Helicobacter pylori]